jgi:hypothetical protein
MSAVFTVLAHTAPWQLATAQATAGTTAGSTASAVTDPHALARATAAHLYAESGYSASARLSISEFKWFVHDGIGLE